MLKTQLNLPTCFAQGPSSWSSSKKLVEIKQEDNAANGQTNEL